VRYETPHIEQRGLALVRVRTFSFFSRPSPAFGPEVKITTPVKPFYASDLDEKTSARARATCAAAGVVPPVLLEDCVLDVAILGEGTAAKVYTFKIPPRTVLPRPAL
jgi:hypothetical protein